MQESSWNDRSESETLNENEIFSNLQVPLDTPFFVRLDGGQFKAISEKLETERPFDKRFAKCLVASAKAIFHGNFSPSLIYVASDEINVLFAYTAPFNRRVEKIDSVLAGTVSSSFSLSALRLFGRFLNVTFDSRIVVVSHQKIIDYLTWRQMNAWRNHNNAYGYWMLRKLGQRPRKAANALKGLKSEQIHELLHKHGINLAKTPVWQRRGVLIYKQPYKKSTEVRIVVRRRLTENWNPPLFTSLQGKALIQQVLNWIGCHRASEGYP